MPRNVRLRVRRWGDGLAVVLPDPVAREEGLGDGDLVEVTVRKERKGAGPPAPDGTASGA